MASISGLSVRVSASVAQFRAGMSRAEDAAQDLALSLRRLDLSTEAAESGLDSAGRSATTTAAQFTGLSFASSILSTRIFGLSVTMWGMLIPALAALSTALAPLIAGFGGFLAIAGAIAGVGIVPIIGALATNTELLKERFMGLLETVEKEFAPVFDLAAEVLLALMDEFEEIIPQLVPAEEAVSRLAGNFFQLGQAIIEFLPQLTELATTLALEFLPPFVTFAQRVLPDVPGMIMGLVDAFRRISPILAGFANWIARISPDLMDFGMKVLRGVANGLGVVGDAIATVLEIGAESDSLKEFLQRMVTSALSWLKNEGLPTIANIASTILSHLETYFETGGTDDLASVVSSFMGGLANAMGKVSEEDIQQVVNQIKTVLAGVFRGVNQALQSDEAGAMSAEIGRIAGTTLRIFADELIKYAGSDAFAKDLQGLTGAIANTVGRALVDGIASALGNPAAPGSEEFDKNLEESTSEQAFFPGRGPVLSQNPEFTGPAADIIEVVIEGDTDVIREVTTQTVERESRRVNRNQGRTPNPTG